MASNIWVCYRDEGNGSVGDRVHNALVNNFDSGVIIRETNHSDKTTAPVKGDIVVIVLDSSWLKIIYDKGAGRSDKSDDFMVRRLYSSVAQQPDITLILVLADSVKIPPKTDMPLALQHLSLHETRTISISSQTFETDINRLLHAIRTRKAVKPPRRRMWPFVLGGIVLLIVVATVALAPLRDGVTVLIDSLIPDRALTYISEGWAEYAEGDYESAVARFERASLLPSGYAADIYEGLGWSYAQLDQREQAAENFDQLVEFNTNSDRGYSQRGWFYVGIEDFERAVADFERAARLNPLRADNHYGLALSYDGMGKNVEALSAYRRYLELDSTPESFVVDRVQELEQTLGESQ
jgi:hypothetical protein